MTRSRLFLTGLLAAIALFALPAGAQAYDLTDEGGNRLLVSDNTTLAVQAHRSGTNVVFTPAAENPLPGGCLTNLIANTTTCPDTLLSTRLQFDAGADNLEVQVDGVATATLRLEGGAEVDTISVEGPVAPETGSIGTVELLPDSGSDQIAVGGSVNQIEMIGPDAGDDRYTLTSTAASINLDLDLGAGNDVVSSAAPNQRLLGGIGNDTLIGPGDLIGGDDNDVLKPTGLFRQAEGGAGTNDSLSYELINVGLVFSVSATEVQMGDGIGKTGFERIDGTAASDIMIGHGGFDDLGGGDGNDTMVGSGGSDVLDGGPGDNIVSYASGASPVVVDLAAGQAQAAGTDTLIAIRQVVAGPGNDILTGSAASEVFTGGGGVDTINAGPGNDIIDGGGGNDILRGGNGSDTIEGGPDHDTTTYDERTASEPINVTLATPGGDGASGENDTFSGVEDVVGGSSNDTLVGDGGPNTLIGGPGLNTLDGGAGNDVLHGAESRDIITGGPGSDQLYGAGDDDSLNAFDNESDVVDCGPSADDDAQVDAGDTVTGCEFARRADVPVPVDADADGFIASFDCNDANASIKPGGNDIPEDGIDQNCDGFDELIPYVDFGLEAAFAQPTKAQVRAKRRGRRISRLVVNELPPRSQVRVACSLTAVTKRRFPKACPFKSKTRKLTGRASQVSLTTQFRKRLLPPGTTIELRITAPGFNGKVRRFTVRTGSVRDQSLCIPRGKTRPSRCPADEE